MSQKYDDAEVPPAVQIVGHYARFEESLKTGQPLWWPLADIKGATPGAGRRKKLDDGHVTVEAVTLICCRDDSQIGVLGDMDEIMWVIVKAQLQCSVIPGVTDE